MHSCTTHTLTSRNRGRTQFPFVLTKSRVLWKLDGFRRPVAVRVPIVAMLSNFKSPLYDNVRARLRTEQHSTRHSRVSFVQWVINYMYYSVRRRCEYVLLALSPRRSRFVRIFSRDDVCSYIHKCAYTWSANPEFIIQLVLIANAYDVSTRLSTY